MEAKTLYSGGATDINKTEKDSSPESPVNNIVGALVFVRT